MVGRFVKEVWLVYETYSCSCEGLGKRIGRKMAFSYSYSQAYWHKPSTVIRDQTKECKHKQHLATSTPYTDTITASRSWPQQAPRLTADKFLKGSMEWFDKEHCCCIHADPNTRWNSSTASEIKWFGILDVCRYEAKSNRSASYSNNKPTQVVQCHQQTRNHPSKQHSQILLTQSPSQLKRE